MGGRAALHSFGWATPSGRRTLPLLPGETSPSCASRRRRMIVRTLSLGSASCRALRGCSPPESSESEPSESMSRCVAGAVGTIDAYAGQDAPPRMGQKAR